MAGEDTFGYTPPYMGPMAQYDTYTKPGSFDQSSEEFGKSQRPTVDDEGKSHDNEADVDHAPLEKLVTMVQAESDEITATFGRLWSDISSLLDFTRRNMKSHADALAEKWNSPAATSFLTHIGAALYSLDEWKKAADENSSGLYALSRQIETSSKEVERLWSEYKAKYGPMKSDQEDQSVGDWFFGDDADLEKLKKDYTDRVRPEVQKIASTYLDVYFTKLGGGTKYKGPLDAAITFPTAPGRPGAPARPGTPPGRPSGTRPAAPTRPGQQEQPERPERPDSPDVPDRPDMPNRPDGLELAGTTTAPPPPAPPQVTMPGGGPGGGPAPAPPPTSPLLPSAGGPGSRPGTPSLRAGNAPSRPSAPPQFPGTGGGRGSSGQRPGMPQLPGRGGQNARSNAPGRGGMPTTPQLPGRGQTPRPGAPKATGQAATPQLPGRSGSATRPGTTKGTQPPATPPSLAGRGGGAGARPGPSRPAPAIGDQHRTPTAGGPELPDQHGLPQARGSAGLGGRRQPTAPGAGGAEPDVRPALGGRGGTNPTGQDPFTGTASAQHRRPQTGNPDEDLWAVDEAAPSVIEKPADVQDEHRDPGPTLGMSR